MSLKYEPASEPLNRIRWQVCAEVLWDASMKREKREMLLLFSGDAARGGLVFTAHRLVYHSTLGFRVIKKKKKKKKGAPHAASIAIVPPVPHRRGPTLAACRCHCDSEPPWM